MKEYIVVPHGDFSVEVEPNVDAEGFFMVALEVIVRDGQAIGIPNFTYVDWLIRCVGY